MIHPKTQLKKINDIVGYGVFATDKIPEGSIVYVKDSLELVISPSDYQTHPIDVRAMVDKYSYIDQDGNRIVSWDFAKYVNHCCDCNTISTGYGFEIAIRNIKKGEQITDEYGIFNLDEEMPLHCNKEMCRNSIKPNDFDEYYPLWDEKIKRSIKKMFTIDQPLIGFVDDQTRSEVEAFIADEAKYKSVYALRLKIEKEAEEGN